MTVRMSPADPQAQFRAAQLRELLRQQAADAAASQEASSQIRQRIASGRVSTWQRDGVESAQDRRSPSAMNQPAPSRSSATTESVPPTGAQGAVPNLLWNDHMLTDVATAAVEQGVVSAEENHAHFELAQEVLAPGGSVKSLSGEDLAAFLSLAGVDFARVDPAQFEAATRFVSEASTPEAQQQRLYQTATSFSALSRGGLPELPRQEMLDLLWGVAEVPGHAFEKMNDAEVAAKFNEIAAVLLQPGKHEVKIDRHELKVTVGSELQVLSAETPKRGFWSRAGSVLKKVGEYAMVAASFVPGPVGIAARIANTVVGAVKAARSKSVLGMIGAAAGGVAGVASAIAGKAVAGVAGATARAASSVQRGAQAVRSGIQAYRSRNPAALLGAVAAGAGVVAGVVEKGATGLANVMNRVKDWASAGRAGFQTAAAMQRGDVLGAIAGGMSAASQTSGLIGHSQLASKLSQYGEYPAAASRVEQAIRRDDFFRAASEISGFAGDKVFDGDIRDQLGRLSRTMESTGRMIEAGRRGDYVELLAIGSSIANDYAGSEDVALAERVLGAGAELEDALQSGEPWAIGRAAEAMVISVKEAAEEIQRRHFTPEIPLTTRQWDASQMRPQVTSQAPRMTAARATSPGPSDVTTRAAIPGPIEPGSVGPAPSEPASVHPAEPPVSAEQYQALQWQKRVENLVGRAQVTSDQLHRIAFGDGENSMVDAIALMPSVVTGAAGRAEELYREISRVSAEARRLLVEGANVEELEQVSRRLEGMIAQGSEMRDSRDLGFGVGIWLAKKAEFLADITIDGLAPGWLKTSYHAVKGAGVSMAEAETLNQETALYAAMTGASIGVGREVAGMFSGSLRDGIIKEITDEAAKQVGKAIPSVHEKLLEIKAVDMADWDRQAAEIVADEVFDRSMNVALDSVFDNVFGDLGKSELEDMNVVVGLEELKGMVEPLARQAIEKVVKAGLEAGWAEMRDFVAEMHQLRGVG